MSPHPAAFHRALLAGPRRARREWSPAPAAAAAVLCAETVLGTLGEGSADLTAGVILVLVAAVGVVLLGLVHLPGIRSLRGAAGPRAQAAAAAAVLVERAVLLAATTSLAAALLAAVVPGLAGRSRPLAVVLVVVVVVVRLTRWPVDRSRRRILRAADWCGGAVVALLALTGLVGALGAATPEQADPPTAAGGSVLTLLAAAALGGALLRPALPDGAPRPAQRDGAPRSAPARRVGPSARGPLRVLVGGVGVGVLLALAAQGPAVRPGARPVVLQLGPAPSGGGLAAVLGVLLAALLLVAAATALSGPPVVLRRPRGGTRTEAGPVAVGAGALVAVLLSRGDVVDLVAGYASAVLLLTALTLVTAQRRWSRALDTLYQPAERRRARRGRVLTRVGAGTAAVLLLLVVLRGWPAVAAVALGSAMMWGMGRHDEELRARLAGTAPDRPLPTVVRAFVLVPELDRPAVRALAYARALRATSIEALTVPADRAAAAALREEWAALALPVPLVELAAPPGAAATAVVEHVAAARRAEPHGLAVVYLPELTARRWWRRLLLGRDRQRLRSWLLALPAPVVTTVPWPLEES